MKKLNNLAMYTRTMHSSAWIAIAIYNAVHASMHVLTHNITDL